MPLKLVPPRAGKSPNWTIRGQYLGRSLNQSAGTSKRPIAAQALKKIERQIERGEFSAPREPTFASAALDYMNAGGERTYMTPLLKYFGNTPLSQIGQAEIDAAAMELYPDASGATRNRQLYTPVSAVLKRAGCEITLRRPKGANGRELSGWLWPEQAEPLLKEASKLDAEFGLFCTFLLYTGERLSEPLKMRCLDVRVSESFAYLPDSKNGEPRPVFLPPFLVTQMRNHPRGLDRGEERLFKFHKSGHLYALLRAAAAKAEVSLPERQAFHIFSHTYATWMRRFAGSDTRGLVGTGRWKDRKSVHRYEHVVVSEEARRAELLPFPKLKGTA